MVAIRRQTALRTLMPTLAEVFRRVRSAGACLTCAAWINLNQLASGARSLVLQLGEKGTPPGITDGLGKHSRRKSFDVQIFDGNQSVVVDQPTANLVLKVRPLFANVRVCLLQQQHGFPATVRATLTACHFALRAAKFLLCLPIVARVLNLSPIAQGGEGQQANVHANALSVGRQRHGFALDTETGVPLARLPLNRQSLNLPFDGAMQFDFNLADFRQAEMRTQHGEAALRMGETVVPGRRTKARET